MPTFTSFGNALKRKLSSVLRSCTPLTHVSMMNMNTLRLVAAGGAVVCLGGAVFFTTRIHANIRESEPFKKSVKLLLNYPVAIQYLGQPISMRRVDLGDRKHNFIGTDKSQFIIPVSGPKGKGTLYTWASRPKPGESWTIDQLDLELEKYDKRWTFYKSNLTEKEMSDAIQPDSPAYTAAEGETS